MSLLKEDIPIAILAVHKPCKELIATISSQLFADDRLSFVKVFILLDDTVDINNMYTVCWLTCANVDFERDFRLANAPYQQIVIDACMKNPQNYAFPRHWPNVVTASEKTIRSIDEKWEQFGLGNFISSPSKNYLKMKMGDGAKVWDIQEFNDSINQCLNG